ncbi:MAG: hypothetical protein IJ960_06890 [Oscillospiraceae bacterium]|nr:hypothetical protein [Oscillospiraceae bacterium]
MNEPNTIPAAQEAQEHAVLNNATREHREQIHREHTHRISASAQFELENQRRAEEALRARRIAAIKHMAMHATLWVIGCTTLIILAHVGHIAGYLMHIGNVAWSIVLGIQIGKAS